MWERLRDVVTVLSTAGPGGTARLLAHSRVISTRVRSWALIHALIALEKAGLNPVLLESGVDPSAHGEEFDEAILTPILEYLAVLGILRRDGAVFRPARRTRFHSLVRASHAALAYHQPAQALFELAARRQRYGAEVRRDEGYDALASADLTSHFSYGFAAAMLRGTPFRSLADLGCGTGAFLDHLSRRGLGSRLYGVDHCAEAIESGRSLGSEARRVRLVQGDLTALDRCLEKEDLESLDVVSLMFVLHEFDDAGVDRTLRSLRNACPRARILLTELAVQGPREVRRLRRTGFPELKFAHDISGQHLRSGARWRRLFQRAGFRCTAIAENHVTAHVCLLFAAS